MDSKLTLVNPVTLEPVSILQAKPVQAGRRSEKPETAEDEVTSSGSDPSSGNASKTRKRKIRQEKITAKKCFKHQLNPDAPGITLTERKSILKAKKCRQQRNRRQETQDQLVDQIEHQDKLLREKDEVIKQLREALANQDSRRCPNCSGNIYCQNDWLENISLLDLQCIEVTVSTT